MFSDASNFENCTALFLRHFKMFIFI